MTQEAIGRWRIDLDPKNLTMGKKLAITLCPNGTLITRNQNPNQPYTAKEVAQQAIAAYKEGAVEAHFHARDKDGYSSSDSAVYIETIEPILSYFGDRVIRINGDQAPSAVFSDILTIIEGQKVYS